MAFNSMTIEEIEKEYCEGKGVQRVRKIEEVSQERYKEGEIPNVFDHQ